MRFITWTLASLILVSAIWVALNLARMGEQVTPEISNSCQLIEAKREISRRAASRKIAAIGASNVLFGIRTHTIAERLNISAMNVGLPASLGIDIILGSAKSMLKPHDTALLAVELFFFTSRFIDGPQIREALFQCDVDTFFELTLTDQAHAVMLQPVASMAQGLALRVRRKAGLSDFARAERYKMPGPSFNSNGDFILNERSRVTPAQREWLRERPGGTHLAFSENSPGVPAIRRFVAWARENQVQVLATWPAVYWPQRDLAEPGLRSIRDFYRSLGVPVLGDPAEVMLPLDSFFDTNNHLTAEAAAERTDLLIQQLAPFLSARTGTRSSAIRR